MHFSTTVAAVTLLGLASAQVSTDGSCGGKKGYTCEGSTFGKCCSLLGKCGSDTAHCSPVLSCQDDFGICDRKVSTDGKCGGGWTGKTCRGSTFGSCCSKNGRCGSTQVECGSTCQSEYGICMIISSSSSAASTKTSSSTPLSTETYPPSSFTTLVSTVLPTTSAAALETASASAYSSSLISSLSASFSSSISSSVSSSVSASVSSSVSSSLMSASTTVAAEYTITSQATSTPASSTISEIASSTPEVSSSALESSSVSTEVPEAISTTEIASSTEIVTHIPVSTSITVEIPISSTSSEAVPTCTPAYFSPPSDWPCFTLTGQAEGVAHIDNKRLGSSYPSSNPAFSREDSGYEPSIYTLNPETGHVTIVSIENNRWMMGNMQAPEDWLGFLPMYEDSYPEAQFPKPFCTLTNERELRCCLTTECQFYGAATLDSDSRRYGLRFGSVYQYETPVTLAYDIVTCPVYDCVPIVDMAPGGEFKNYRPERKEDINPAFYKRALENLSFGTSVDSSFDIEIIRWN